MKTTRAASTPLLAGDVLSRAGFWLDAIEGCALGQLALPSLEHATAMYVAWVAEREGITTAQAAKLLTKDYLYNQLLGAAESER